MNPSNLIFRMFEVRAKPGCADRLRQKLSGASIAVVKGEPGNRGYFFGDVLSSDGDALVFISVWRDMASIKARFGADWQQSFLPEGYEELIEHCSVSHMAMTGGLLD